jgi:hypothetical protein
MAVSETMYLTGTVDVMLELLSRSCPLYFSGAPDVESAEFGRCAILSCVSSPSYGVPLTVSRTLYMVVQKIYTSTDHCVYSIFNGVLCFMGFLRLSSFNLPVPLS